MKSIPFLIVLLILVPDLIAQNWKAKWISQEQCQSVPNTWLAFRKEVQVTRLPKVAIAKIAADSKYWLWINGNMVIREGGLKRGPNPRDTYYDEVDVVPYLKQGGNLISILVWYFGKDGFSHKSSGKVGLLIDCQTPEVNILSDKTWDCKILENITTAGEPQPNYRLSESSIVFDASNYSDWYCNSQVKLPEAMEFGDAGDYPWNQLYLRPIPQWKDYGLKEYVKTYLSAGQDTAICDLPYNAQVTPQFKIDANEEGQKIIISTDNNWKLDKYRTEYITKKGIQEFECFGWMNGHKVFYFSPKGIKIIELKYRETGYNAEFTGNFTCNDRFFNTLWEKARRTVYLNMRDNFTDCPDRERGQWSGDAVNESQQTFYAFSTEVHALSRKWLEEILNWQKHEGVLFAPVPAGNWTHELPGQMLSTIGTQGLWNYYMNTGDQQILKDSYDKVKKYLSLWKLNSNGTLIYRPGDWPWGDWGENKDIELIYNILYFDAMRSLYFTAKVLQKPDDADSYIRWLSNFKLSFNKQFWTNAGYRHPDYKGLTDDRVQSLAVVTGLADKEKYPVLFEVFKKEQHASPYMEKEVLEALFAMGNESFALERCKNRFAEMVKGEHCSTLHEQWDLTVGTNNHGWSGGPLIILSKYLCGVAPVEAGYAKFHVIPQPGSISKASVVVPTIKGDIKSSFEKSVKGITIYVNVPHNSQCVLGVENKYSKISLNGIVVWRKGKYLKGSPIIPVSDTDMDHVKFLIQPGTWNLVAKK